MRQDTKTQEAVALWNAGNKKAALKIFSRFKIGVTEEQQRIIGIAAEVIGNLYGSVANSYRQMDVDVVGMVEQAAMIVTLNWVGFNHGTGHKVTVKGKKQKLTIDRPIFDEAANIFWHVKERSFAIPEHQLEAVPIEGESTAPIDRMYMSDEWVEAQRNS